MRYLKTLVLLIFILIFICCKTNKNSFSVIKQSTDSLYLKMNYDIKENIEPYLYRKLTQEESIEIGDNKKKYRLNIVKDLGLDYLKSDTIIFIETDNLFDYYCCVYTSFDKKTASYHYSSNSNNTESFIKTEIEQTDAINAILNGKLSEYIEHVLSTRTTPPIKTYISVFYRKAVRDYDFFQKTVTTK